MVQIVHASLQTIQSSFFIATMMNVIFFSIYLTLGAATIHQLRNLDGLPRRTYRLMTTLIGVVAFLYTLFVLSMSTLFYKMIFVSLGSSAWVKSCLSSAFSTLAAVSAIGDALFLYRCWIIWERSRLIWIASFVLLAEFVILLATDILIATDGTLETLNAEPRWSERLSIAAPVLTVFFNCLLASAAIARLLLARRKLRRAALPGGGAHYVHIAHLLAVSTVLYAAGWIPIIVWRGDTFSIPHLSVLFFLVSTLPLVIMLHVAWRSKKEYPFVLPAIAADGVAGELGTNDSGDMIPTFKPFRRESDGTDWYDSRDAQEDAAVWRRESDATVTSEA